jgi:3-oxoadipate enol-lactonase
LAHADLRDQIAQIQIPTLLIAGKFDPVTTVADAEFMQQQIKIASLQILQHRIFQILSNQRFTQELTSLFRNLIA